MMSPYFVAGRFATRSLYKGGGTQTGDAGRSGALREFEASGERK